MTRLSLIHISDSQGRTVDFKNTVIILTSNLGTEFALQQQIDLLAGILAQLVGALGAALLQICLLYTSFLLRRRRPLCH